MTFNDEIHLNKRFGYGYIVMARQGDLNFSRVEFKAIKYLESKRLVDTVGKLHVCN